MSITNMLENLGVWVRHTASEHDCVKGNNLRPIGIQRNISLKPIILNYVRDALSVGGKKNTGQQCMAGW